MSGKSLHRRRRPGVKPILFNTEMVRALLSGQKTVTRRAVKPQYKDGEIGFQIITNAHTGEYIRAEYIDEWEEETRWMKEPYKPGDILYVRETWGDYRECQEDSEGSYYLYRADYPDGATTYQYPDGLVCDLPKWRPSIHMPAEAARIFLRVTDVRVEQLQDINGAGIKAEGTSGMFGATRGAFINLWNSTVKLSERELYGWDANPWVWVIEFERCEKPEAES